jgi:hypothetical protein
MRGTSGSKLRHLYPTVLGKMRRDNFVRVFNLPLGRYRHRRRHSHHNIRLRNVPTPCPISRRWAIVRISSGSLGRCPGGNRRNLLVGERSVVRKVTVSRIGKPWRHHLHPDGVRHGRGPRTRLIVGHERHRRHFSRTVTTLAVILKDGQNVLVKSRRSDCGLGRAVSLPSSRN